tara:strand:- start:1551 stop:1901 length:351 start_codon:yes stop_codon:yes gene_type:complete
MSWHTHRTNSGEREYLSTRNSVTAQAQDNPFLTGIRPDPKYGAVDPELDKSPTFAQPDSAGNIAPKTITTGDADEGSSGTADPNEAQDFASRKVMERMQMIANGENHNLNDHSQIT